jgi:four helix bundle protein
MEKTYSFQDLEAWKTAHKFVLKVYKTTSHFPKEEIFGLTAQFRKASVSIDANIAEGYKKKGKSDKLRFFNISQGSIEECNYYLILSKDLSYISDDQYKELLDLLDLSRKLLNSYYNAISKSIK